MAEHQRRFAENAAFLHLHPKVIALAAAFAHAGKNRIPPMFHCHVMDELLDEHCFAHAGTAEQSNFAAFGIRLQKVDHLDPGFKDFNHGPLLRKGWSVAVDLPMRRFFGDGRAAIDRRPKHVEHPPKRLFTHRHLDPFPLGMHLHAAHEVVAFRQHNAAHGIVPRMLHDLHRPLPAVHRHREGFFYFGQLPMRKRDVDDWP